MTPVGADAAADAELAAQTEAAVARIRLVFGPAFPVLAPFALEPERAAEWTASFADQDALYASHAKLALAHWQRMVLLARPRLAALASVLDAALWLGASVPGGTGLVAQLPHVAGRAWAALPFAGEAPRDVPASAVVYGEPPTADARCDDRRMDRGDSGTRDHDKRDLPL